MWKLTTYDRQETPRDGRSSLGFWPDELKKK